MLNLDVNWLAIVLATIASVALGMGWYMVLSKQWIAATGKRQEDLISPGGNAPPFFFAAACQLVMAYFIAVLPSWKELPIFTTRFWSVFPCGWALSLPRW